MGGCVATARRHSLLGLPYLLVNILPTIANNLTDKLQFSGKRIRDAAFFLIIMLVTFAATLLKPQNYVSSRTIQKCVEHVSTST